MEGFVGGQKIIFEPYALLAVYKYVHCLPFLYYVTYMLGSYGEVNILTIWSCAPFKNKWQKKKLFSVFNVLGYQ